MGGPIKNLDPDEASGFLNTLPLCMISLNPDDLRPVAVNEMFERTIGPLYKFQDSDFCSAASDDKDSDAQARFREAIEEASNCEDDERIRVRSIEMLTVTEANQGFPIRRFFDWFISRGDDGTLLLLGDPCTEQDVDQRGKDAELIDFFQNAPIALHWLSGTGKVIWANQTELNVLGYTAEEYIGQDIMKFCPDEEELVLEIFKQLGSGNAIKDVPVRFRSKDGKIVHLLIDSNVRYEKDGSFGHTRCFIRDDTGRKIRESHASLLLEETKRSLAMLDNFMARSLHHLRTPLHITQNMVDSIAVYFKSHAAIANKETNDCIEMVKMANEQISQSVAFLDDIADLAKFDQGAVLHVTPEVVELETFGKSILNAIPPTREGVRAVLDLRQLDLKGDGPSMAVTDPNVLRRLLMHLLNNAVDVTHEGTVSLGIGYKNKRLTFSVSDTGPGLEMPDDAADGDLPVIFQRYHQEFLPEDSDELDLTIATSVREKIEKSINSHKKTGMGIGLSLTYHLVQALGGEIRCTSKMGEGTKFQFSLPRRVSHNTTLPANTSLVSVQVNRKAPSAPKDISSLLGKPNPKEEEEDAYTACSSEYSTTVMSSDVSTLTGLHGDEERGSKRARSDIPSSFDMPTDILPIVPAAELASLGVMSQDPPSILVVEDTNACAKMLCRVLSQFKCATKWAENGAIAIEYLKAAPPGAFDLILMDLRMPVMDGLEATRIIKDELGDATPIIALTGDDNEATRDEAEAIGFDGFYGKPMKRDDLKSIIKEFTGYEVQ